MESNRADELTLPVSRADAGDEPPCALRRERRVEGLAALGFASVAAGMAIGLADRALPAGLAAWLVLLCVVLLRVEFEVGEGRTRPVQLALVPMLLLLPPAWVPALVAAAHVLARLPEGVAARRPLEGLAPTVADAWFAVAPALVLTLLAPSDPWAIAAALALAMPAQVALDFAVASLRLRIGLGLAMRPQLAGFAWVYLIDALLAPVGVLAAAVGQRHPWAVASVLPLAGLLAVFARERHGRIQNALELHRMAEASEARLQSIVQNSSDLI